MRLVSLINLIPIFDASRAISERWQFPQFWCQITFRDNVPFSGRAVNHRFRLCHLCAQEDRTIFQTEKFTPFLCKFIIYTIAYYVCQINKRKIYLSNSMNCLLCIKFDFIFSWWTNNLAFSRWKVPSIAAPYQFVPALHAIRCTGHRDLFGWIPEKLFDGFRTYNFILMIYKYHMFGR